MKLNLNLNKKTLNETIQNLNGINNKLIQVSIEAESLAMQLEAADLSLEQRQQKIGELNTKMTVVISNTHQKQIELENYTRNQKSVNENLETEKLIMKTLNDEQNSAIKQQLKAQNGEFLDNKYHLLIRGNIEQLKREEEVYENEIINMNKAKQDCKHNNEEACKTFETSISAIEAFTKEKNKNIEERESKLKNLQETKKYYYSKHKCFTKNKSS